MTNTGFRIAPGWISAGQLNSTSSYLITNFTRQSDMNAGRQWFVPGNVRDLVLPYAELVRDTVGMRWRSGGVTFKFPLRMLTPLMVAYLQDNLFTGNVQSCKMTMQTYNRRTGVYEAYNGYASLPDWGSEATLAGGGFDDHIIEFVGGVIASSGPDISPAQSFSTLTVGIDGTNTVTVTNNGTSGSRSTASTYANIVLTHAIPATLTFVSATGSGWTLEYSINSGASYSSSIPSPASLTTNIRATYAAAVVAGSSANALTITYNPASNTSGSSIVAVSTSGDTNTANDSNTTAFTVANRAFDSGFNLGFGTGAFDSGFPNDFA